ncbi:MAG TPA: arylsulfotransferase family protein [Candidatus Dormibacteraeota bacterium]
MGRQRWGPARARWLPTLLSGTLLATGLAAAGGPLGAVRAARLISTPAACPGVSLYPSPGTATASAQAQVSFQGMAAARLRERRISISGSVSGVHQGRLVPDSSAEGASFRPDLPFSPGETVTVRTDFPICDAGGDSATFQVARSPAPLPAPTPVAPAAPPRPPAVQAFVSRPDLKPPRLLVSKAEANSKEGDIFLSPDPVQGQPGQAGPMIVNGEGQLIWFDPMPKGELATDLRTQTYQGRRVLTFFQGKFVDGHGQGEFVIMNDHYQVIRTVVAGEGYSTDLHELVLGPGDTAWLAAYSTVGWNLSSVGGPTDGAVYDCVVQELDLRSGNVLFEWHSLDHVAPASSYIPYNRAQATPWDYFHLNSIDPLPGGRVLLSGRNTDGLYLVDEGSGQVAWTLGGKRSSFAMGPGTEFSLQHDAELHGASTLTLFDDEDDTADGPPARALELRLDPSRRRATLVWARQLPGFLLVLNQGNVQLLPDGGVMVGWGAGTYTTEYDRQGRVVFDAHFPGLTNSYRAYRDPWTGSPTSRPTLAVRAGADGRLTAFASWNGSTAVTGWRVTGGASSAHLAAVGRASRSGFETKIALTGHPALVRLLALGQGGKVIGRSAVISAS